jgi:hypothetical protein
MVRVIEVHALPPGDKFRLYHQEGQIEEEVKSPVYVTGLMNFSRTHLPP